MKNVVERVLWRAWLNILANVAVFFGRKRHSLELYRQMIELNPRDEIARASAGNLLMNMGDRDGAAAQFRAIVGQNPGHADAWFNLGFILEHQEQLTEAEQCFRRAVALDEHLDRAWYGLGLVLIRVGRLTEAVEALKKNTTLQPFSPYGYYQLSMTYHHLGQGGDAWRVYEQLKHFEPRYAATLKRDLEATPSLAKSRPDVVSVQPTQEAIPSIT